MRRVLSPFLFTLYTLNLRHNTVNSHLQKFSDDTAIVNYVSEGNDQEYRKVIKDFVCWCECNNQCQQDKGDGGYLPGDSTTRCTSEHPDFGHWDNEDIQILGCSPKQQTGLDWQRISPIQERPKLPPLLRRLRSFGVCRTLLRTFCDTVVC